VSQSTIFDSSRKDIDERFK